MNDYERQIQNARRQAREGAERAANGVRLLVGAILILGVSYLIPGLSQIKADSAQAAELQEAQWNEILPGSAAPTPTPVR